MIYLFGDEMKFKNNKSIDKRTLPSGHDILLKRRGGGVHYLGKYVISATKFFEKNQGIHWAYIHINFSRVNLTPVYIFFKHFEFNISPLSFNSWVYNGCTYILGGGVQYT